MQFCCATKVAPNFKQVRNSGDNAAKNALKLQMVCTRDIEFATQSATKLANIACEKGLKGRKIRIKHIFICGWLGWKTRKYGQSGNREIYISSATTVTAVTQTVCTAKNLYWAVFTATNKLKCHCSALDILLAEENILESIVSVLLLWLVNFDRLTPEAVVA